MDYVLGRSVSHLIAAPQPGSAEETALIQAAQAGSREAFDQLMLAHHGRLSAIAHSLLGDAASAEDAVQEAMLAAYRHLHTFRSGSFKHWLMRIVTHKAYDALRDKKRRRAVSWENAADGDLPLASHEPGPEAIVQRRELARRLDAGLGQLARREREMLLFSYVHGLSYQEIAAATASPLGTVKSRLNRARGRLRAALQANAPLPGWG